MVGGGGGGVLCFLLGLYAIRIPTAAIRSRRKKMSWHLPDRRW